MTTEQLRKEIEVANWHINYDGISITYYQHLDNIQQKVTDIKLNPEECARQLSAIGSIDSWESQPFRIFSPESGDDPQDWITFAKTFKLSQWEALTLAIRHEYELSIEQDSNMMNITNAVNKLNHNG